MANSLILFLCLIALTSVNSYRLPNTLIPDNYKLEILTYLPDNFTFEGKVWIKVNCTAATDIITLHSTNLTIISANIVSANNNNKRENYTVTKIEELSDDLLNITIDRPLTADKQYEIIIRFRGELNDNLQGFYKSSYKNENKTVWLATTQFESTYARSAFPCFDEPAFKATFQIVLGRKQGYNSISNMPLMKTEEMIGKPGWYWDFFYKSVPMSTYLVAFVISDFECKESPQQANKVVFKICSRPNAINQIDFARQIGPKVLEFFETFFDIKYPLPKQDMLAIPDFSAGAMENWGLITYRETTLLFDPKVSSLDSLERIANVIAHELAHQWFGNLVTMKWWTDLWLNEGFATYMASYAVHKLFPKWQTNDPGVVNTLVDVLSFDALNNSHPISVPIGHPSQINEIFDTISYKKGSFIIRMMSEILTEETLRRGVSNYLNEHAFGNAEQDDLWKSLTTEAHKKKTLDDNLDVKTFMDTWTLQTGYPLLTVERNYKEGTAIVSQKPFLNDQSIRTSNNKWWVPLSYASSNDTNFVSTPKDWLSVAEESKKIENVGSAKQWVLFNIHAVAPLRVNYDVLNWNLLIKGLKNGDPIPIINKAQLLDDSYTLASAGLLDFDIHFNMLSYLMNEKEYIPWKAALSNLAEIKKYLQSYSVYGCFRRYVRALLEPSYSTFRGFNLIDIKPTDLSAIKQKIMMLSFSCEFDVGNCVDEALGLFRKWMTEENEVNPIPKDFRKIIYKTAIRYGGEKEWNFLWEQYKKANVATERSTMQAALAYSRDPWILKRYLKWSLDSKSGVKKQDASTIFAIVSSTDHGFIVAKQFFYENAEEIQDYFSSTSRRLGTYLHSMGKQIITPEDATEFEEFIKRYESLFANMKQSLNQSQEKVKLNLMWMKANKKKIEHSLIKELHHMSKENEMEYLNLCMV